MKLSCSMAEDLLPLYLEESCSQDSRLALEEHLHMCPACREKLKRMKNDGLCPPAGKSASEVHVRGYAEKIRRRRLRMGMLAMLGSLLCAGILALCFLAVKDMRAQANPMVYAVEEGVYNLTAGDLETTSAEVGTYRFFTNYTQIQVRCVDGAVPEGELTLWDATDSGDPWEIQYGHLDPDTESCVFTGLTAQRRYQVTWEGSEDVDLVVSEGRTVSFFRSLRHVVWELLGLLAG